MNQHFSLEAAAEAESLPGGLGGAPESLLPRSPIQPGSRLLLRDVGVNQHELAFARFVMRGLADDHTIASPPAV